MKKILGIDKEYVRDEAEFQQIIKNYIKEDLMVEYKIINIERKDLLIIKIPAANNSNRPFMVKTQIKYLGNMYSDLKEDFIECPRISSIDEYYYPGIATTNVSPPHIPSYIGSMHRYEQTYLEKLKEKADDFKYDIENIFEDSIYEENDKIIIKTDFKKIMQNKSMFLEAKLLFKSDSLKELKAFITMCASERSEKGMRVNIKIDYEIRTKNISKTIHGVIES